MNDDMASVAGQQYPGARIKSTGTGDNSKDVVRDHHLVPARAGIADDGGGEEVLEAQEPGDGFSSWIREHLSRSADLTDRTAFEDGDPVREEHRFAVVMGHVHSG